MNLQENEVKVLKALLDGKERSVSELVNNVGLDQVAVARAVYSLQKSGLTIVKEKRIIDVKLSGEGKEILKKDLPEKRLIKKIGKKEITLQNIDLENKQVAIGWGKRKNWIVIAKKNGKVYIKVTRKGLDSLKKKSDIIKKIQNPDTLKVKELDELKVKFLEVDRDLHWIPKKAQDISVICKAQGWESEVMNKVN